MTRAQKHSLWCSLVIFQMLLQLTVVLGNTWPLLTLVFQRKTLHGEYQREKRPSDDPLNSHRATEVEASTVLRFNISVR